MNDFTYPFEFLLFLIWLSAPALLLVVITLGWLFARRGLAPHSGRPRTAVIVAGIATLVLTVPLWMVLPTYLLPVALVRLLFLPGYAAGAAVVPVVFLWTVRTVPAGRP